VLACSLYYWVAEFHCKWAHVVFVSSWMVYDPLRWSSDNKFMAHTFLYSQGQASVAQLSVDLLLTVYHLHVKLWNIDWQQLVLGPGRWVPKCYPDCCCCSSSCSWNQFSKNLWAFLICGGVLWNLAYKFVLTFPTDLPSQIFKLISSN